MPKNLFRFFAVLAISAALASSPLFAKNAPDASKDDPKTAESSADTFKQLTLFSDVLERIRADYVDPVPDSKLIENALNGMLSSLDPHSSYLDKKSFQDMQTQTHGEFGGLGIEITMENGIIKVVSPIDDTPAARAGMQPNDYVTHINSKPVTDYTMNEAVDHMRGTPGTKVVLTIRRGSLSERPFDLTLTRAIIRVQSVRWEAKDDVAYIRISTFNEQTQVGLNKALNEADKKLGSKLIGYVIDLRNNPGGLLDEAVSVASTFLDSGKDVVSTRGRHKEDDQVLAAKGGDKGHGKPIAILINNGSASASEIVAGALQDHKRAILVGTKSFGKGSVQTIIPVSGGGAMRLTTARYYTPSGRSIQALGIEPDIVVQQAKLEKLALGPGIHEADLKGALQNENSKDGDKSLENLDDLEDDETAAQIEQAEKQKAKSKSSKNAKGKKDGPFDYQLARALDLIRGIHLYEARTAEADKGK
ncbi:MAG: S41 family peptidase [Alphaproteobacteria bacterium]|nr:S41 family peptidase [Alphaproteobacteria bacterium]